MKKELKQCKEEKTKDKVTIMKLQEDLQESKLLVKELEDRANYMEDYNRRNNLQVIGIEENPETTQKLGNKRLSRFPNCSRRSFNYQTSS